MILDDRQRGLSVFLQKVGNLIDFVAKMGRGILSAGLLVTGLIAKATTNEVPLVITVVSRGERTEDASATMAANVEVFDATAIENSTARDLPELLSKAANLQIRTLNANPLQSQIAMGGFGENSFGRIKVMVDGEELNTIDLNAPELTNIPLENLSRVEIIHGSSAVLYGDGAEAGVIRLSTEPLDYTAQTRLAAKVGSYGAAGLAATTRGGLVDEGVRYSAGYRYERADGYRRRSGYDLHAFNASLRQDFENGSTLGLKVKYANSLYQMPGALTWEEWKDNPQQAKYEDDWCRMWNYSLSLDSKLVINDEQYLRLDGAFSMKHRTSHWGDFGYANDYDLYGYQFSPRYVNTSPIGAFANEFTLGFDARYDYYTIRDRSGLNNPEYYFTRTRGGAFVYDVFSIYENLSLVVGARLEGINNRWTHYRGLNSPHSTDYAGDYELGLSYRPWEDAKLYLKGSRFHKSAFSDEMNYTESGEFLKPEKGTSLDFGMEITLAEEFHFDAMGYWIWLDDEIFYNPHARDFGGLWGGYNCNSAGRTERRGTDLSVKWEREKMAEASLSASFVDARFTGGEYSGKKIPLVPAVRVRAEAGIWLGEDFEVKGGYRFISSQPLAGDFDNDVDSIPGYSLFDLALLYAPFWAEGWKISLVVDNLFDRHYCDFAGFSDYYGAYYYPAAGRSFLLTMSYTW